MTKLDVVMAWTEFFNLRTERRRLLMAQRGWLDL